MKSIEQISGLQLYERMEEFIRIGASSACGAGIGVIDSTAPGNAKRSHKYNVGGG